MITGRYVARIVLEAVTPLKVGSGESDFFVDAPVIKDWNGLPMIPGTSIAGVLRHSYGAGDDAVFGKVDGSRLLVSHAHLLDEAQKIHYELGIEEPSPFVKKYYNLPAREHTAINDKGTALPHSKFDEEVVYAGSRFAFELELIGGEGDEPVWQKLLSLITSPLFRLGSGSTKGFGEVKVVSCHERRYTLGKDYAEKPGDLNVIKGKEVHDTLGERSAPYTLYTVTITPEDFFSFGSGFGDDEVDDIAVTEEIVTWQDGEGGFGSKQILFPASSLKGALSHRVAFHYNRLKKHYADHIPVEAFGQYVGENNPAVAAIFGRKKEKGEDQKTGAEVELGRKGIALFSDLFKTFRVEEVKRFDHVKIDRFTGGTIDAALYSEKVTAQHDTWQIEIVLVQEIGGEIREAFECSLDDLCNGLLPLGGKVNRGHGVFTGQWNCKEVQDA